MNSEPLHLHLDSGVTTVARAWRIVRQDGLALGFTDHDRPLSFDGMDFTPETGMTAKALQQTTSLSVDNTEAIGALQDDRIAEIDINAGLYDDAEVVSWLVNWANPNERKLIFRGNVGDIKRSGGAFEVELRGLTDRLNRTQGRVYQKPCSAVLGDAGCKFDLTDPNFHAIRPVLHVEDRQVLFIPDLANFDEGWFSRGRLIVQSGVAQLQSGWIQTDGIENGLRKVTLWQPLRGAIAPNDQVLLQAGCDKRHDTCISKFDNVVNFQGFPFIPGEDWLASVPRRDGHNDGGALV